MHSFKCILLVHPEDRSGAKLPPNSLSTKLSLLHNSINFNISSSDQFTIFKYCTSAYHACQTIIVRAIYSVMASAHALERFWNGKRSHCTVGPFWNILERQLWPFHSRKVTFAVPF